MEIWISNLSTRKGEYQDMVELEDVIKRHLVENSRHFRKIIIWQYVFQIKALDEAQNNI